ncbi:MAG: 3-phosphoshikimate 1-carboxyvinyltransferase [Phycisphaerales bacterium]
MSSSSSPSDVRAIAPLQRPFDVVVRVPGSKSITNRCYVLAALASGTSRIGAPLASDDTDRLLAALVTLGVGVRREGGDVLIEGCGGRFPHGGRVDLGDGGTPTRFLIALASLAAEPVVIDGSERMRERPVDEGIDLVRRLGGRIEARVAAGVERLPVTVLPSRLRGGELVARRTASSQFLSALLLVAPTFDAPFTLRYAEPPTSASYLDLTVASMHAFGAHVAEERDAAGALRSHRVLPQALEASHVDVEPDASSAAYFAVAAAIMPAASVKLVGIGRDSRQPDVRLFSALESMGASVARGPRSTVVRGPRRLRAIDVDASLFPDAALALAVACARADGASTIRGLRTLRVKESDRIAALAAELERVGCTCEATDDALVVRPGAPSGEAVVIETYRDHRMAMSFATLGLVHPGLSVRDPACVAKSYPGFWQDFAKLHDAAGFGR